MAVAAGAAGRGNLSMDGNRELYAAIDLGSNSFHMLVVRPVAGSVQVVAKIKRKVRLAAGLGGDGVLDAAAMARGWDCLALFAERLQDIPRSQIRVVATATLRLASNAADFAARAGEILGVPLNIIPGDEEARLIYLGVAHTSSERGKRLVESGRDVVINNSGGDQNYTYEYGGKKHSLTITDGMTAAEFIDAFNKQNSGVTAGLELKGSNYVIQMKDTKSKSVVNLPASTDCEALGGGKLF